MLARSWWTLGSWSRVGRFEYTVVITARGHPELRSGRSDAYPGRVETVPVDPLPRRHVRVLLTSSGTVAGMEDAELEQLIGELLRLPGETAAHRAEISRLAAHRRELATALNDAIGPTLAARRLGISRQTFWQVLNPEKAQAIKRRSSRARHDGVTATASDAT